MPDMVGKKTYAYLKSQELEALVKYSTYHKEKSKKWQKRLSASSTTGSTMKRKILGHVQPIVNCTFDTRARKDMHCIFDG